MIRLHLKQSDSGLRNSIVKVFLPKDYRIMRNIYPVFLILSCLLSACQSYFGPDALKKTHPSYNQAIVSSLGQQMLLNLVRLKYRDQAYFLKVGSITASLTLGSSIGIGGKLDLGPGGNVISPSLGLSYADRPTISYSPLQGEDFLKSVLSSISLEPRKISWITDSSTSS